jgi:hypothetical protein
MSSYKTTILYEYSVEYSTILYEYEYSVRGGEMKEDVFKCV